MAMRTGSQFMEDQKKIKREIYLYGEKRPECVLDDELLRPVAQGIANVLDLMNSPLLKDKCCKKSSCIPGEDVNLWCDIFRTPEDWIQRVRSQRVMSQRLLCVFRCVTSDWINGLWAATWECDQKHGTRYHERLQNWVKEIQKNDWVHAGVIIPAKGDRSKSWVDQKYPDVAVHIVERKKDGVVVRGVNNQTTYGMVADELYFVPGSPNPVATKGQPGWTEREKDYAVCFRFKPWYKGVKFICRPPGVHKPRDIDYPMSQVFAWTDCTTVFDNVFIPDEDIFLCGEWDSTYPYVKYPLEYAHLAAKAGCKAGRSDLHVGMARMIARYNGVLDVPHVQETIYDMIKTAETCYGVGIAAAYEAIKHPSGVCFPNPVSLAIPKLICSEHSGHEIDQLMEMAGGIVATGPSGEEWKNPETRKWLEIALSGHDCDTEDRFRMIKLIEDYTCTEMAGLIRYIGFHAGGPRWMMKKVTMDNYDFEDREETAKMWAGIVDQDKIGFAVRPPKGKK